MVPKAKKTAIVVSTTNKGPQKANLAKKATKKKVVSVVPVEVVVVEEVVLKVEEDDKISYQYGLNN